MQSSMDTRSKRLFGFFAVFDPLITLCLYFAGGESNKGISEFLKQEFAHFEFSTILFDLVIFSVIRSILCVIVFFKERRVGHFVAISTTVSSIYILVKCIFFDFRAWAGGSFISYILIVTSLAFAWADFYIWFVQMRGEIAWNTPSDLASLADIEAGHRMLVAPQQTGRTRRKLLSLAPWRWVKWRRKNRPPIDVLAQDVRTPLTDGEPDYEDTLSDASFQTAQDNASGVFPYTVVGQKSGSSDVIPGESHKEQEPLVNDPSVLPPSQYSVLAGKILQQVVTAIDMESGWDDPQETETVSITRRKIKGTALDAIKGTVTVFAPAGAVFKMVMDPRMRTVNTHTEVVYRSLHGFWPTSGRDFVYLRAWIRAPDGTFVVAETSIPHASVPETKKFVRGQIILSGFLIRPLESCKCELSVYHHIDAKGMVPSSLANIALERQALICAQVKRFLDYMYTSMRLRASISPPPQGLAQRTRSRMLPGSSHTRAKSLEIMNGKEEVEERGEESKEEEGNEVKPRNSTLPDVAGTADLIKEGEAEPELAVDNIQD